MPFVELEKMPIQVSNLKRNGIGFALEIARFVGSLKLDL